MTATKRRSKTVEHADGLEIVIPAKRNLIFATLLSLWFVGWCFGEGLGLYLLLSGRVDAPRTFVAAWLVAWTFGGALALDTLSWMMVGREVIRRQSNNLIVQRIVGPLVRTRTYEWQHVRDIHVVPGLWNPPSWSGAYPILHFVRGPIAFHYFAKHVRIADGVNEIEAQEIVRALIESGGNPG